MWLKDFSIPAIVWITLCERKYVFGMFTTVEPESLPKDSGVENKGQRSVADQTK